MCVATKALSAGPIGSIYEKTNARSGRAGAMEIALISGIRSRSLYPLPGTVTESTEASYSEPEPESEP